MRCESMVSKGPKTETEVMSELDKDAAVVMENGTIAWRGEIYYPIGDMKYINASRTFILDLSPNDGIWIPYIRRMTPYVAAIAVGVVGLLYISM